MASVVDQNIPSEFKDAYEVVLGTSEWLPDDFKVKKRYPFRVPMLQGCRTIRAPIPRGSLVSAWMCAHRKIFGKCVSCFNRQPVSGGVEPPDLGPRNRSWWYDEAQAWNWWYYTYFMKLTLDEYIADGRAEHCLTVDNLCAYVNSQEPGINYFMSHIAWVAKWPIYDRWLFLKAEENIFDRLYLFLTTVTMWGENQKGFVCGVYEVEDEWFPAQIIWGNKPDLGRLISTKEIYKTDAGQWVSFYKDNAKAICIKILGPQGYFLAKTWRYSFANGEPYYAP